MGNQPSALGRRAVAEHSCSRCVLPSGTDVIDQDHGISRHDWRALELTRSCTRNLTQPSMCPVAVNTLSAKSICSFKESVNVEDGL